MMTVVGSLLCALVLVGGAIWSTKEAFKQKSGRWQATLAMLACVGGVVFFLGLAYLAWQQASQEVVQ